MQICSRIKWRKPMWKTCKLTGIQTMNLYIVSPVVSCCASYSEHLSNNKQSQTLHSNVSSLGRRSDRNTSDWAREMRTGSTFLRIRFRLFMTSRLIVKYSVNIGKFFCWTSNYYDVNTWRSSGFKNKSVLVQSDLWDSTGLILGEQAVNEGAIPERSCGHIT